jgi:tetratricopeptide (TPR) repeat protein
LGDPDYSFGFGRILKVMLEDAHPGLNFEIINTSITAINSHVILPVIKETVRKINPDVVLVYAGNNEVIGPYGPNAGFSGYASKRWFIRLNIAINSTRIGMLFRSSILSRGGKKIPQQWDGMEMFLDYKVVPGDKRYETVQRNFRANLDQITRIASGTAKVILSNVAVNQRDCPPFYSIHGEALSAEEKSTFDMQLAAAADRYRDGDYEQSRALLPDAHNDVPPHALAHYLVAEAFRHGGFLQQASGHYEQAVGYDALKFRADNSLNAIVEDVSLQHQAKGNVFFLDMASKLKDSAEYSIPGSDMFLEHVHYNFYGNYLMAFHFKEKIEESLNLKTQSGVDYPVAYYAQRLAYTPYEAYKIYREILRRMDKAPFTMQLNNGLQKVYLAEQIAEIRRSAPSESVYLEAIKRDSSDWILHSNYFLYLTAQGIFDETALQLLQKIKKMVPQNPVMAFNTGYYYEQNEQYEDALLHYDRALDIFPYYRDAKMNAASMMLFLGDKKSDRLIAEFAGDQEALFGIWLKAANIASRNNQSSQAERFYKQANIQVRNNLEVVQALSTIYLTRQEYRAVLSLLKDYMIHDQDNYEVLFKLGIASEGIGDLEEALAYYERASQIDASSQLLMNRMDRVRLRMDD